MFNALSGEKRKHDEFWPQSPWVFSRRGEVIKDFSWAWEKACKAAGVPDLHFHDLRRTAVRNMRRAGIPQVIRMKISGHKTDSMERRYNIADMEDLANARELLDRRAAALECSETVVDQQNPTKPGDTSLTQNQRFEP
jgi:integrase